MRAMDDRLFAEAVEQAYYRLYSSVIALDTTGRSRKASVATEEDRQACVLTVLSRLAFLMAFKGRGWFRWQGRCDYVMALCDDTRSGLSGYLFAQRLARVFDNATRQAHPSARELVRPVVGDVPYLGPSALGSVNPTLEDGPVLMLADEAVLETCSPTGLFSRFTFSPDGEPDAVSPDQFVTAVIQALGRPAAPAVAGAGKGCAEAIERELGPKGLDAMTQDEASKALKALGRVHMMDEACGVGDGLVAFFDGLKSVAGRLHANTKRPETGLAATVANLVGQNVRAVDPDPVNAFLARFRLASRLLALSTGQRPVPLPAMDMVVKSGGMVVKSGRPPGPGSAGFVEGPRTEFKATFEWDTRKQQRNPDHLFASLKTVAAFMNASGGMLYLGVDDGGEAIGLDGDLSLIDDPHPLDIFEMRFREAMKNHIQPIPLNHVQVQFISLQGKTVAKIEVSARSGVTYLIRRDPRSGQMLEEIYVRDGNRTLNLNGRTRDQFVLGRYGAGTF